METKFFFKSFTLYILHWDGKTNNSKLHGNTPGGNTGSMFDNENRPTQRSVPSWKRNVSESILHA
jgi:hypothetical protein